MTCEARLCLCDHIASYHGFMVNVFDCESRDIYLCVFGSVLYYAGKINRDLIFIMVIISLSNRI